MRPTLPIRRVAVIATGLGACLGAPASMGAATVGNVYTVPPASAHGDPGYTVNQAGGEYTITNPASTTAEPVGVGWVATWPGCSLPGTELASIQWRALRLHDLPGGMELRVDVDAKPAWSVLDSDVPLAVDVAAPGKGYQVAFPPGTCGRIDLRLAQAVSQVESGRVWIVRDPTVAIRDLAPPSAAITQLSPGWVREDATQISWRAADNLGDDGIGEQRVLVAGQPLWRGAAGEGEHSQALDLHGVADGVVPVELEVDGDGTPGASAAATLMIDRTPPVAAIAAVKTGPATADLVAGVVDATSGVSGWIVYADVPGSPAVASSAAPELLHGVDLSGLVGPGGQVRFLLLAADVAGNINLASSAAVARDAPPATGGGNPPPAPVPSPPITAPAVPVPSLGSMPNLARVRSVGLTSPRAGRPALVRGVRVPVVLARGRGVVVLRGRFVHPGGRGLRGASVYLVDPAGQVRAQALTDRRGAYALRVRAPRPGAWTVRALGLPPATAPVIVRRG
jgi:hypothetical protein